MRKGFTMIELLVVLLIVGILAAVAAPMYLANTNRAKASEGVALMSQIRQAERDYRVGHSSYFDIDATEVDNPLPTTVTTSTGARVPDSAGVDVDPGVVHYFDDDAVTVNAVDQDADGASGLFVNPGTQDFLITINGANSEACSGATDDDCSTNESEVENYRMEMDNSGRIFVSYNQGTNWSAW